MKPPGRSGLSAWGTAPGALAASSRRPGGARRGSGSPPWANRDESTRGRDAPLPLDSDDAQARRSRLAPRAPLEPFVDVPGVEPDVAERRIGEQQALQRQGGADAFHDVLVHGAQHLADRGL